MDTVTYPDRGVAEFIERHFLPVRLVVKQEPDLVEEYLVHWTPNVVLADGDGRLPYRIEGYLPPTEFLARLALGLGKYWLHTQQFDLAGEHFEEVARRHAGTEAGAEALYWLGVAAYKHKHDSGALRHEWRRLEADYPSSEWTRRTQIPRAR